MRKLFSLLALLWLCASASAQSISPTGFPQGAWAAYTPTYAATGGTGVTFATNAAAFLQVGKTLFLQVSVTVNFTTAPSFITISLPNGAVANLANSLSGTNYSLNTVLAGFANNVNAASVYSDTGTSPVTVTGQVVGIGGVIDTQ